MKLHQAQKKIARDTHRFRVVCAGRRTGKTVLAVEEIAGKAVAKNDTKIAYIAPTLQQARDICWEQLKSRMQPLITTLNESRLEMRVRTQEGGTSLIQLKGWEAIESLRGQSFDFIVIDEVAMMRNFWTSWSEVIRPTLSDRRGEVLFLSTPKGYNHFYDLYLAELEDENFKSYNFTTYDNPNIPREEIEDARTQMTEDQFEQEYMANFRKQEGLIYKQFRRDRHVIDYEPDHVAETMLGIDFGWNNPAAIVKIVRDRDSNYYITDEWKRTHKTEDDIAEWAASMKGEFAYPDPEQPAAIQKLRDYGLNVKEVRKEKGSVLAGIDVIQQLLSQNRLKVHKSCVGTIEEFESYRWKEKPRASQDDLNEPEEPEKANDHCMDALRYAIYMNHGKRKEITPQQMLQRRRMRQRVATNHAR